MTLYHRQASFHRLEIKEACGIRLLTFERNQQSSMRLDDPFETDIEYVAYLHLPVAIRPEARRSLVLGLGGGSLVKRMWRDYQDMVVDAVELDEEVYEVAVAFFELPQDERINVYIGDGRDYIESAADNYDIIVIDAFDDDRIPRHLTTEEFLRACRDRLNPGGVVAYNIIGALNGRHSKPFRSLYRTASNVWRRLWVFTVETEGGAGDKMYNIVMLATDADISTEELHRRIKSRVGGKVTVPGFECFGEHMHPGKIRSGDVALLLDE